MSKFAIVGGHGNVSMRLARLLAAKQGNKVISIIRNADHAEEIANTGAEPLVLSIESDSKNKFANVFEGKNIVYFSAGAGGKGGPERTRKVDYEGALKVFDALELVKGDKPRLIMVSAIDVRDRNIVPAHYTEEDKVSSKTVYEKIGSYMQAKYEADKNLVQRTAFQWTILRPSGLTNDPGSGKATVGKGHLQHEISRDDVALTLALLAERPDAAGLGIDLVGGDENIEDGLDTFIKKVTRRSGNTIGRNARNRIMKKSNSMAMDDIDPIMHPSQSGSSDDGVMATIAQQMQASMEKKKREKEIKFLQATQAELSKTLSERAHEFSDGVAGIDKSFTNFQDAYAANEDHIRKLWDAILQEQLKLQVSIAPICRVAFVATTADREKKREQEHIRALAHGRKACEEFQRLIDSLDPNYERA
ncbi:hypothetical protein EW145_g6764 [Phellinidium pouzarii]|uniref:NAD(P)-binding domain-containing protein n=1 Tax=Phellinidium pouzarii TaxID=167371 RepID=A0A4S4KUG0_9AGAM|nr:hypothetical protein EW145_g6764 [Phellinidium pouzarii]